MIRDPKDIRRVVVQNAPWARVLVHSASSDPQCLRGRPSRTGPGACAAHPDYGGCGRSEYLDEIDYALTRANSAKHNSPKKLPTPSPVHAYKMVELLIDEPELPLYEAAALRDELSAPGARVSEVIRATAHEAGLTKVNPKMGP